MKEINIYTDGSCSGNPGPGGWGVILEYKGQIKELSGGCEDTTNQRMELTAVIKALEALKQPCQVTVYTDSRYVSEAVNLGWARGWKARCWKLNSGGRAKNIDLWEVLLELLDMHKVTFIWVKGHNGHSQNERCDVLATIQTNKYK